MGGSKTASVLALPCPANPDPGADLLTNKQAARLTALFAIDERVEVEATWGIYQRMIAAYRHADPAAGRELVVKLIKSLSAGVPRPLVEIAKLGRTPEQASR